MRVHKQGLNVEPAVGLWVPPIDAPHCLVHGFLVQDIGNDNVPDALNALTALIREVA